jgi:hypothetical protein
LGCPEIRERELASTATTTIVLSSWRSISQESRGAYTVWHVFRRSKIPIRCSNVLDETRFQKALALELKRSARSQRRFSLLLLELGTSEAGSRSQTLLGNLLPALPKCLRDTDMAGWYKQGSVIGVILSELGSAEDDVVAAAVAAKVGKVLHRNVSAEQSIEIAMSLQIFPQARNEEARQDSYVFTIQGDLVRTNGAPSAVSAKPIYSPEPAQSLTSERVTPLPSPPFLSEQEGFSD